MKPTPGKPTWFVFTNPDIYNPMTDLASWAWVAHGPHGSESGVAGSAEVAVRKAQAASYVLSDERSGKL